MDSNYFQHILPNAPDFSNTLQALLESQSFWNSPPERNPRKKTRGRKKLRPGNPLKTEVMDKYWLRSFRNYIKSHFFNIKTISVDKDFWQWYITKGKPGRKSTFLSYNANYKERLFGNSSFCGLLAAWGMSNGYLLNLRNSLKDSWKFYFEYFSCELVPRAFSLAIPEEFNIFFGFVLEQVVKHSLKGDLEELTSS